MNGPRPGSVADPIGWGLCLACATPDTLVKVRYVRTLSGVDVPVDVTARPDGPLVPVIAANGARRVEDRGHRPADGGRPGFFPHWDACRVPAAWARERAALAAGVPSPAAGKQGRASLLGPCAGCYRPDHTAYGPGSTGTLCASCKKLRAAALAQGAEMASRRPGHLHGINHDPARKSPLQYPHWKGGEG